MMFDLTRCCGIRASCRQVRADGNVLASLIPSRGSPAGLTANQRLRRAHKITGIAARRVNAR